MTSHTIEATEKPILKILCDDYLFRIPPYQRPYAWTTEQAGELLSDLLAACGDGGEVQDQSPYFLGSIVLIKHPQRAEADVVDGQQRLTTLTILLCVLRDLASSAIARSAHGLVCQTGDPLKGTRDVYRLRLRERDAGFFEKTIQHEAATSKLPDPRNHKDSEARFVENAAMLRERLLALDDTARERLTRYLVQRCFLVVVAASDQESAFRIFSVLNSRGLDLSPADILKAEIIGAVPVDKREEYTERWESLEEMLGRERFADLFGHIRMIHRKQKIRGTLVAEFREYVPYRNDPAGFIDRELTPCGDAYEDITDRSFSSFKNAEDVNRSLRHLARLDNIDWQPPAIDVFARWRTDPDFILRFVTDLERLAYGLFLTRADATTRIGRYGALLQAIQAGADLFTDDSPLQLTAGEKAGVLSTLDDEIYTVTRIRLPLLLRLDSMLSGGAAEFDSPIVTVEHVLPQNPALGSQWMHDFPEEADRTLWVHRLANLVLLTQRKNSQAGNLDFAEKKARYFMTKGGVSAFPLTSQVLSEATWTLKTLHLRQKELIDKVAEVWRLR